MNTELKYLAYTALLTGALWIPYVLALLVARGVPRPANYRDPAPPPLPFWGVRANRVHMNAVEAFAPFAALIIIAHLVGKENATTALCAVSFFWLRLTHAVIYLLAIPYLRTLIFTAGFIVEVTIFVQIMA